MNIRDFIQQQAEMMRKIHREPMIGNYTSLADFLIQHAREFTAVPLPASVQQGKPQQCYANCQNIAASQSEWIYCEGYAAGVIPVWHGWLWNPETDAAIDPTWTGEPRPERGHAYLGVPIATRYVIVAMCRRKEYSPIIDDWINNYPILRDPESNWKVTNDKFNKNANRENRNTTPIQSS